MSLDSLLRMGQIKPHAPTAAETLRLLAAAQRNLEDSQVLDISDETRFDAGYKAIMQCALVALMASGYRPATNVPGHHRTLLGALSLTLAVPREESLVLDALRKKRNNNDYAGDLIDPASVRECTARAEALLARTRHRLAKHHAELLEDKD